MISYESQLFDDSEDKDETLVQESVHILINFEANFIKYKLRISMKSSKDYIKNVPRKCLQIIMEN